MMNEARLGVSIQGLALSEIAYQNAVAYARDRLQGRSISGVKAPSKPADPLLVHPDIRRNLLTIKAFNEAARALVVWTALQSDISHRSPDPKARLIAEDLLGLMTPVLKGYLTDVGFDNCVKAQQVFGGHGYIAEWGMEQFVRDARIAMIYEGANGIQALDLVGRKLGANGGRAITGLFNEVMGFITANEADDALKSYLAALAQGVGHLQQASMWFLTHALAKPDNAGAGAYDYMQMFGLVSLGYMWVRMLKAAQTHQANDVRRLQSRQLTATFFFERMLPETAIHLARITAGADTLMTLDAEQF